MRAKLWFSILAIVFIINNISATEYYAVWHANGCQLEPKGQGCFNAQNSILQWSTDPNLDWTDEGTGLGYLGMLLILGTECTLEGAYDALRALHTQTMYIDNTRGYSDLKGTHAFYENNDRSLEILIGPEDPIPQSVIVDSDRCIAPKPKPDYTCSLEYVMGLINQWQNNQAELATVIDAINHWASSECTAVSGLRPHQVEKQKAQLMTMLQGTSDQVSQCNPGYHQENGQCVPDQVYPSGNTDTCPSMEDIVKLINGWKADTVELGTVMDAINKWSNCDNAQGVSPEVKEQQKAQFMAMLQNPSNQGPYSQETTGQGPYGQVFPGQDPYGQGVYGQGGYPN